MRSVFSTILCIFLVNQVILSTSNVLGDEDGANDAAQPEENIVDNARNKTTVLDLIEDCLAIIADHLETPHLIKLSAAHAHFQHAVKYNLQQRLAKKTVYFDSPYTDGELSRYTVGSITKTENGASEFPDKIYFRHFPLILEFLEKFGHLIKSLNIIHSHRSITNAAHAESIWQATNRYCSENLTSLDVIDHNVASLSCARPFTKLEHLSLEGSFNKLSGGNMFPALRSLVLGELQFVDPIWLNHSFPLLNDLILITVNRRSTPESNVLNKEGIEQFLQNNRNIKTLLLTRARPHILESVANELQQLEHLTLVSYKIETATPSNIQFPNLKTLIVHSSPLHLIENITFDSLEEYEVHVYSPGWIESMKQNPSMRNNLRKLRIKRGVYETEILNIANADLNLTEIILEPYEDINIETILRLTDGCQSLQKLRLRIKRTFDSHLTLIDAMQERLAEKWTITESTNYIELERKEAV